MIIRLVNYKWSHTKKTHIYTQVWEDRGGREGEENKKVPPFIKYFPSKGIENKAS